MDSGPADSGAIRLLLLWRSRGLSAAAGDVPPNRRTGHGHFTSRGTVRQECDGHINDMSAIRARRRPGRPTPFLWSPRGRLPRGPRSLPNASLGGAISKLPSLARANSSNAAAGKHSTAIRPRIGLRRDSSGHAGERAVPSVLGRRHLAKTDARRGPAHCRPYFPLIDPRAAPTSKMPAGAGSGHESGRGGGLRTPRPCSDLNIRPSAARGTSSWLHSNVRNAGGDSTRAHRPGAWTRTIATTAIPPVGESKRPAGAPPAVAPIQTLEGIRASTPATWRNWRRSTAWPRPRGSCSCS